MRTSRQICRIRHVGVQPMRRLLVALLLLFASLAASSAAQQMPADDFLLQLQQTVDEAIRERQSGQEEPPARQQPAAPSATDDAATETGLAAPPAPASAPDAAEQQQNIPQPQAPSQVAPAPAAPAALPEAAVPNAQTLPETTLQQDIAPQKQQEAQQEGQQALQPATQDRQAAESPANAAPAAATHQPPAPSAKDTLKSAAAAGVMPLLAVGLLAGLMLGLVLWAALQAMRRLAQLGASGVVLMALGGLLLALAPGLLLLMPEQQDHALRMAAAGDVLVLAGAAVWLLGWLGWLRTRAGQLIVAIGGGLMVALAALALFLPQTAALAARALLPAALLGGIVGLLRPHDGRRGASGPLALAVLTAYGAAALLAALGIMPLANAQLALLALLALAIALAAASTMPAATAAPAEASLPAVHAAPQAPALPDEGLHDAGLQHGEAPEAPHPVHPAPAIAGLHDPLTGLPNDQLLLERIEHALLQARAGEGAPCLIVLDIDRYRFIFDSHGPAAADALLAAVAERLSALIGEGETLARLPADQFGIIIDATRHGTILAFVQRLREVLQPPFTIAGEPLSITVSLGIVDLVSVMQMSAREAYRAAEIALYEARRNGPGQEAWFTPEMLGAHSRLAQMEQELRQALIKGELKVRYQPIMRLGRSPQERRLAGFEALVRWEHPRLGLIGPEQFIDVAEELGLIGEIGQHVLADAIRQLGIWQRTFRCEEPLFVAVNISAKEMIEPALLEQVRSLLAQEQADAAGLKLELTESLLLAAPDMAGSIMRELASMGISLVCDDFGTGYSSLARLKHLPFNVLKIDRSFLKDGDVASWNIVHAIVTLAQGLNMEVVAEGVEDAGQLEILEAMGCHMVQGWLLGKPLKSSDVLNAMTKARRVAPLNGRLDALSAILFGEDLAPFDSARHGRSLSAALAADKAQNDEGSDRQKTAKPAQRKDAPQQRPQDKEHKPPQAAQ